MHGPAAHIDARTATTPRAGEAVLEASPSLADRGPDLPASVRIELPGLDETSADGRAVRLWD